MNNHQIESKVSKYLFYNGGCTEFAFVLKEILEETINKNKFFRNIKLEYCLITARQKIHNTKIEDNLLEDEYCHGVIRINKTNFYIDVDGINYFKPIDYLESFRQTPISIYMKTVDKDFFLNSFGKQQQKYIKNSYLYLLENKNLIENIIENIIKC